MNAINLKATDELGQQPLHIAAERGDLNMVQQLLNKAKSLDRAEVTGENMSKIDIEEKDKVGKTSMTEVILNAQCNAGQTVLHRASWGGSAAVVKFLLDNGANTNIKDNEGNSALNVAAEKGFEPVVDKLLEEGRMDCTAENQNQNEITPLHLAARSGQKRIVLSFLTRRAEVDATDIYGWSPLHYAAESGQRDVAEILLNHHANIELKDGMVGWTPLHFAAINGHRSVLTLLRERNATIEPDNQGWTPWLFAELKGHSAVLGLPSNAGIDVDFDCYVHGFTTLHCAAITKRQIVATQLLDEEVYSFDKHYHLTLLWAAEEGSKATTKLLLDDGVRVDCGPRSPFDYDSQEQTALSLAAASGHVAVAELLLDKGARIDSWDRDGRTPLSWASGNGHMLIVELLLRRMATIDLPKKLKERSKPIPAGPSEGDTELLCRDTSVIEEQVKHGCFNRTPLSWAAGHGHVAIM